MPEHATTWQDVDDIASRVAGSFALAGVVRIEVFPYEDSFGRSGVQFVVWLRDKSDASDYAWSELSPIEHALSDRLQQVDPTRIPYTTYVLESEAAERRAATG